MNFKLYVDDDTGLELNRQAQIRGESRNALIRRALREWLQRQQDTGWPQEIAQFEGVPDWLPFESHREELSEPGDPFA